MKMQSSYLNTKTACSSGAIATYPCSVHRGKLDHRYDAVSGKIEITSPTRGSRTQSDLTDLIAEGRDGN